MTTRLVHRVRCRHKTNKQIWADVKVVDAVLITTPSGTHVLMDVRPKKAKVCIVDKVADGRNAKGSANDCTRLSHMELVTSATDSKQQMYIETLDAVTLAAPKFEDALPKHGQPDTNKPAHKSRDATFGIGHYMMAIPKHKSHPAIVDKTGLALSSGSVNNSTRVGHVNLVTEKGNTDDHTDEADAVPPLKQAWIATVKTDAVSFGLPGGTDMLLSLPKKTQEEIDVTHMTTDPLTHEPCPPDNTDPHVYVDFPDDAIGCNIKIPADGHRIDQGPLWWIEKISGGFQPWFWFAQVQSPLAFSYFGSPGRLGSWGYRGFVLWNYYPVIWILSVNNPLIPMGSFGSPTLDLCAREGNWDFGHPPVPYGPVHVPARPIGGIFPFSALSFVGGIFTESAGKYGPFGHLQMTHPPLGNFPDAVPYGNSLGGNTGSQIYSGIPNIWQLCAQGQPPRVDPTKPWNPFTNPIIPPPAADAENVAKDFAAKWNSAANGHNGFITAYVGTGKLPGGTYSTPPGWSWNMGYYDPFLPTSAGLAYYGAFRSGIPVACATSAGIPLVDFIPATAWTMDVGQLDPATWNVGHLELYNNPINWFLPLVVPPLLWPTT